MATLGLKGIWGLEQLDNTGISTGKLGLILLAGTGAAGFLSTELMLQMEPNPVFGPMLPQALMSMTMGGLFLMTGLLVLLIAFARAVESDLNMLAFSDAGIEDSIAKLRPTRSVRIACLILGLGYGLILLPVLSSYDPRLQLTVIDAFVAMTTGGPHLVLGFVLAPMGGIVSGAGVAIVISQISSLIHAARHIRIDLLRLDEYASIANPGVRLLLCWLPLLSTIPLLMLYADDVATSAAGLRFLLFLIFVVVVMVLPYIFPVWILRNRIRDSKLAELHHIKRSLQGHDVAANAITIQGRGEPNTTTDLLIQQMFLESRWDWPIASHIQKLVLFGLLPPATWILAAMIENLLY